MECLDYKGGSIRFTSCRTIIYRQLVKQMVPGQSISKSFLIQETPCPPPKDGKTRNLHP